MAGEMGGCVSLFSPAMTKTELARWLKARDIDEETCEQFEKVHKINGKSFPTLTKEELKEMEVPMGPRKEILALIEQVMAMKLPDVDPKPTCGHAPTTTKSNGNGMQEDHQPEPKPAQNGASQSPHQAEEDETFEVISKGNMDGAALCASEDTLAGCSACWKIQDHTQECLPLLSLAGGTGAATISDSCFWSEESLNVYINPDTIPHNWRFKNNPINGDTISIVAKEWEQIPHVPKLCFLFDPALKEQCQIRIDFSETEGSHSQIGRIALYTSKAKPTMILNLGLGDDQYKRHLILHEFGHALGLAHEHQSSSFFKVVKKFINWEKMKKDLQKHGVNMKDWEAKQGENLVASEYDPDSIMHYWMDNSWLKDEYKHAVKDLKHLDDTEKKILAGIRRRHQSLPDRISDIDRIWIGEKYEAALNRRHSGQDVPDTLAERVGTSGAATRPDDGSLISEVLLEKFRSRSFPEPEQRYLVELVGSKIPSLWEGFGIGVGIDQSELDAFKGEHSGKAHFDKHCFNSVFVTWENWASSSFTWLKVAEVMVTLGRIKKASKLYNALEKLYP